jgi:hypothetical protein
MFIYCRYIFVVAKTKQQRYYTCVLACYFLAFLKQRVSHLKRNPNYNSICKLWWHQYNKTHELCFSFYFLGRTYRIALQQMLKMSTTFSKASIHPKFYHSVWCCLNRYFLVRKHNVKCFTNSKKTILCSRMNTRSAREYTMFVPTQVLRNWRKQRPNNMGDFDSSVTGEVGRVYYEGGGPASDFIFVP